MRCIQSFARWRILLLAPLGTAVLSCTDEPLPTAPTLQTETPAMAVAATRAMKISGGVLNVGFVVPPTTPCLQMFNLVIEGNATHLGHFEGVGSGCATNFVVDDPVPPFLPPGPPPYLTGTFSNPLWVLTAANGDELWLESHDATIVISLSNQSTRARGTHVIIGGTGRFAGATGEIQSSAVNEDGQGPDDFESSGWIRF